MRVKEILQDSELKFLEDEKAEAKEFHILPNTPNGKGTQIQRTI